MSEGLIDVHAHAVLASSEGAAGAAGPELGTSPPFYRVGDYVLHGVRYAGTPFMDVDLRLAAMDAAGIALHYAAHTIEDDEDDEA